jgi:hypothetical protein
MSLAPRWATAVWTSVTNGRILWSRIAEAVGHGWYALAGEQSADQWITIIDAGRLPIRLERPLLVIVTSILEYRSIKRARA